MKVSATLNWTHINFNVTAIFYELILGGDLDGFY